MLDKTLIPVTDPKVGYMHYKETYFYANDSFEGSLSDSEFFDKIKDEDVEVESFVFSSKSTRG